MDDKDYKFIEALGKEDFQRGLLLKNGIIPFHGEIYSDEIENFSSALATMLYLQKNGLLDAENITIRIEDSGGGTVSVAFAIYDTIRDFSEKLGLPVVVRALGGVYSAACAILLQAGDERIAAKNSTFLLHEVRQFKFFSEETRSDIEDQKVIVDMLTNKLYELLSNKTGKTKEEIDKFIDRRNVWLDAKQALEWGLIDRIE